MADVPPVVPPAGGTPQGPAGSGNAGDGGNGGTPPAPPSTVSYEAHRQLLDEKKKADAKLRELETEKSERERKEAEAQGNYQKLLDAEREKTAKLTAELTAVNEREAGRRKLASVLGALNGHVDAKFYDLIPYDEVRLDAAGAVEQTSVTAVVEKVRARYPEIIKTQGGPNLPPAAPQGGGTSGKIKRSEWLKLSTGDMKKWKPDQVIAD